MLFGTSYTGWNGATPLSFATFAMSAADQAGALAAGAARLVATTVEAHAAAPTAAATAFARAERDTDMILPPSGVGAVGVIGSRRRHRTQGAPPARGGRGSRA